MIWILVLEVGLRVTMFFRAVSCVNVRFYSVRWSLCDLYFVCGMQFWLKLYTFIVCMLYVVFVVFERRMIAV